MSIQTEIDRIKGNIDAAFTAVKDKGGTNYSAANRISANLKTAIKTIPDSGPNTAMAIKAVFAALPSNYKEVAYIDLPSGSSGIATGISLSSNPYFEYKASLSFPTTITNLNLPYLLNRDYAYIPEIGNYYYSGYVTPSYIIRLTRLGTTQSSIGIQWGGSFEQQIGTSIRDLAVTFESVEAWNYNSTTVYNAKISYGTTTYNGNQSGNTSGTYQLMYPTLETDDSAYTKKVYYFRTFDSKGKCTHNLIPCKSDKNVPGLYDIISEKFYVSTRLTNGPDVVPFIAGAEVK